MVMARPSGMVGFAKADPIGDLTMTDETTNLRKLVEKPPDADVLREIIGSAAERLMELEVGGLTGGPGARASPASWSRGGWQRRR